MLDQKYLLELFEYKDGELYWKISPSNNVLVGSKAGTSKNKYNMIGIKGVKYSKHKIIFMMIHAYCPELITFLDNNPQNCKIENLKELTRSDLHASYSRRKDNTSGYKGVSWGQRNKKWVAIITKNGKTMFLGGFDNIETAHKAYCQAAKKYYGEFANVG